MIFGTGCDRVRSSVVVRTIWLWYGTSGCSRDCFRGCAGGPARHMASAKLILKTLEARNFRMILYPKRPQVPVSHILRPTLPTARTRLGPKYVLHTQVPGPLGYILQTEAYYGLVALTHIPGQSSTTPPLARLPCELQQMGLSQNHVQRDYGLIYAYI